MAPADAALGLLGATIWAGAFLATEAALRDTPPILFAACRFALTGFCALAVARPRIGWRELLALGLLLGVTQHALIFIGMAWGVPPGMAALLAHTQSFFTVALAVVVLGEALSARRVAAFALAALGLALLIAERGQPMPIVAVAMTITGAIAAAFGNLVLRRLRGADPLATVAWMGLVAGPPLLALSLALEGTAPLTAVLTRRDPTLWVAALYSGLASGLLAYAIWARLFARYESARVAPFMLLVPPLGIVLSLAAGRETLSWWRAGAAAAIVAGLALAAWRGRSPPQG